MTSSDSDRIAVLIDADNTSPKHASPLMEEVAKYGNATVKRAYGDWTTPQLGGWKSKLNQHAIQPMQQFAYTVGKNSTDSALIIDAMDLLYSGNVDAFALVSSDSDFTRLATRLRESGMTVIGLGLRKTPQSLVSACDRFVYLELLTSEAAAPQPAETAAEEQVGELPARQPDLKRLLTTAVDAASHDDGWASLSAIGSQISRSNPSFDPRDHGESKLLNLVRKQTFLDVEQPESGGVRVRLSSGGPARKAASRRTTAPAEAAEPEVAEAPAKKSPRSRRKPAAAAEAVVEPVGAAPEPVAEPVPAVKKTTRSRRKVAPAEPTPDPAAEVAAEPVVEAPKVVTRTRSRKASTPTT